MYWAYGMFELASNYDVNIVKKPREGRGFETRLSEFMGEIKFEIYISFL